MKPKPLVLSVVLLFVFAVTSGAQCDPFGQHCGGVAGSGIPQPSNPGGNAPPAPPSGAGDRGGFPA